MANTDDIRTTGPVGLKGLTEEQRRLMQEYLQSQQLARRAYTGSLSPGAVNTTDIQRFSPDDPMASWGRSKYDNPVQPQYLTEGEMQDVRHENQSSWDVLANGVGKMLGKAGTTFVSSLVGIPYGIGTAIVEGRASGLWDNDVTSALANADKWMEENLKNYKSTEQEQAAWYDPVNLFSMNFLADDVITNAGFTLGAAAASAVGAGSLGLMSKAFNVVNNASKADRIGKNVSNVLASLFSATGEGMIEAKQGVEERNKGAMQALEQELAPEKNALALEEQQIHDEYEQTKGQSLMMTGDGGAVDPAWVTYQSKMEDLNERKAELQRKYDAGKQQIFESGRAMGNKILLGNQVLLTAGNLIQFGKAMSKSYDNARHAAVNTSKTMKPSWMKDGFNATAKNPNNLREGYEMSSKNFGRFRAATKGLITEGSEEMNQQLIQSISSAIYDEKDANDYWRAKLDRPSYREATKGMYTLGNIISQGFKDSWGNLDQWEQFVIGGLTGMSGTVMPSKIFNQDKSKSVFNPARYLSWEGGAWNAVKNFNEEYNKYAENIEDLNKVLQGDDFFTRMQDMAARTYRETKKAEAAAKDDKKTWKDEDDKQTIHDIQAFVRAGKLDDLRTIIDEMGKDMSDDDVESFVKATTHEVSEEEDKKNHDAAIDEQIAARQKRIDELNAQLATIQDSEELFTEGGEEALSSSGPSMSVDTGGVSVGGAESTPSELDLYSEASAKKRQELLDLIAKENAAIEKLKQDKKSYAPHKSYDGPFVSTDGNRIKTPDEIKAEIKHNANEMHRKVDSYLESIAAVEEKTKGRLTKEQEDNLAYLHNVSKEKMVRFDKIMSGVRKKLPRKFLIKTDKTPEQLTEEYASSDLAFSKEHTPEGWVEVNTSMLDDANFGRFFMDTVMRGDNISTKMPEEKAEEMKKGQEAIKKQTEKVKELKKKVSQNKAEKQSGSVSAEREVEMKKDEDDLQKEQEALDKLTEQYVNSGKAAAEELNKEAEKEAKKQQRVNIDNMRDHFYETMRKNTNMTLEEVRDAFEDVKKDIVDAATLEEESWQFNATLNEYMRNPQKVEQTKKKEEKKAAEKVEKENAKKMTVRELSQRSDLKDLLAKAKSDNDVEMVNKIKRAMVLRKQQATMQNAKADPNVLKDYSPAEREAAFQAMQQKLTDELNIEDKDIDKEKEIAAQKLTQQLEGIDVSDLNSIIRQGLDPVQRAVMDKMAVEDPDAYLVEMEKLSGKVQEAADELQTILTNAVGDIDAAEVEVSPEALEAVEKAREGENPPPPAPPKVDDVVSPVLSVPSGNLIPGSTPQPAYTGIVSNSDTLKADMVSGTKGYATGSTGQHPWRSVTRRVGNRANKPYSEVLDDLIKSTTDENKKRQYEKQKIRTEAVEKFLEEKGAFTRVEKGEAGGTIKFKVFKAVNDTAEDFVIFMTDASGNVLADLPSSDSDIEPGTAQIAGLADFYEEARKQWDALSPSEQENPEGFMLKGLETKVNYTYIGKVRYLEENKSDQENRQSVSSLFGDKEFLLGVKIREKSSSPTATIRTGKQNSAQDTLAQYIIPPLSGSVGQPYVLIPTSDSENKYSSERYMAVPILTPRFGEISKDSTFYKVVEDIINRLKDGNIESTDAKVLLGKLFSVSNIHINFGKEESSKGEGIKITTYSRPDRNAFVVYSGTRENINTEEVLNALGQFQINISLSDINNNKKEFYTLGTTPVYYNSMIGKIATTNAAAPHTVNDFFTVVPLEKKGDSFKPVEVKPARMKYPSGTTDSVFNVQVEYKDGTKKNWKIDPMQDFTCFDDKGVAITKDDTVHTKAEKELAAQYRAEAYGRFYMKDFSKPFTVMFNDRAFVYYPATREFRTRATLEPTAPRYKEAAKEYDRLQELLDTMEEARQLREASKNPPVQPATPIEEQLIEHLKSLGFKVHNRAELEKYLNRNGETNIQEAVAETQEMQEIRNKAIANGRIVLKADGTFDYALAPNGEKSNLNERQWLQVRTKAFKKWFGDWERVAPKNIKGNLINQNGEINWDYFEQILNNYHNSQPDSMFAKGRTTLATREEKHFEGEKNTLNHIKFVTQSMLNLFEGKFDADLPFVSEARASLQNQKDLMVLTAMFHDAAKPYRHGDVHGWESADILRDVVGIDYNNRLAEWAIRHHMAMPFSHKAEFNLSNPEALEVARNMARDAKRIGIDAQTAINAFVLINAADIINGREITVEDNWAKKARAAGSTKFGDDISVKAVLTTELKEKVDLLKKAFEDIKDEDLGNPEQNYRNQSRFDYTSYPEGGREDGKLPYLSNVVDNGVSKVVDENGEPLVVYHGTSEDFNTFELRRETGFHFGTKAAAEGKGNVVKAFFLNIKELGSYKDNMWYGKKFLHDFVEDGTITQEEADKWEREANEYAWEKAQTRDYKYYDGLLGFNEYINKKIQELKGSQYGISYINTSEDPGHTSYLVFNPNQIKSATSNNGEFSTENDDIQMAIEEFKSAPQYPTVEEQKAWVDSHLDDLTNKYLEENGNKFDSDEVRELLSDIGYNKENLAYFKEAGDYLADHIQDVMFERLAKSDNKTITVITGTPGSGKSYATKSKEGDFAKRGMVLDSAFHTADSLQGVIDKARKAGIKDEDIQIVAIYNDAITTYKNTIARGKKINRWIPMEYFFTSFRKNRRKIKEIKYTNPDVEIVTIDNSNNKGKEVSLEEAFEWDYEVTNNQIDEIIKIIEEDEEISRERKQSLYGESEYSKRAERLSAKNQKSNGGERALDRQGADDKIQRLGQRLGLNLNSSDQENLDDFLYGVVTFLNNFDISLNDVMDYEGEMPLFDALNRTINIRSIDDITEGVGQAIAFMMQYNPAFISAVEMKMLEQNATALKNIRRVFRRGKEYSSRNLDRKKYKDFDKSEYIKLIGKDIAKELRRFYSLENITKNNENSSYIKKLWDIIVDFFKAFNPQLRRDFRAAYYFSSDAAMAVGTNSTEFVRYTKFKPGAEEEGEAKRVDLEKALRDFPYEESIISTLNQEEIGLAGGAAIAAFGRLMRPGDTPLHDLDFQAGNKTPEEIDSIVNKYFEHNKKTNTIVSGDAQTETYLILDRPFTTEEGKEVNEKGKKINIIKDAKTGEVLGQFVDSNLALKDGVQGKFLDFFRSDTENIPIISKTFNGKEYKVADYNRAMKAKVTWQREKDIFDYANFQLDKPAIQEFKTSQGEVYGFVDENGDIYLDETVIKPEHPIHEYTHIWDRALAKRNPALWRKGISLMKETSLWNEIANSPNYGKKWEAKEGMTASKLEFLIASEVHARLVGKHGEQILNKLAQEKGQEGIIAKLKAWILEAWKALKQTFGNWTAEEIERLTLEDFKNMTVRDFADGVNLNEEEDHTAEVEATISEIQKESENYILCDVNGKENPEGNYYKDKRNGTLHARVTSMIEGDPAVKPFKETNDDGTPNVWITPSTTIGNQVDEFIRAFFEGVDPMTVHCPNLSDSSKRNLIADLQEIQKKLKRQGWEVASRNIMATGLIGVTDANGKNIIVRTAGTLDLLLYNPKKGTYAIYDIKTHRGKVDDDKINKWTAQLSLYKQLLETKFPQLKGRISGMRIIPLTVDGYDAYKEDYHKEGSTLLNAANEPVITNVKYDGNTIPIKERNLTISMGKEGFKKEYNEEGKKHIIYEPRVKPGEGPKQRIKEGTIEAINKIPSDVPFELCVKEEYLEDETVQQLGKTIDEARKNNTLQDLVFTSDTIDLLSKIINDETVNNFAVNEKLNKEGLTVPPLQQPSGEETQEDLDEIAKEEGFIPKKETPRNRELTAAWNSLSDENKKKVLSKSPSDFKDAVSATRQGGSINDVIDSTYHRKATESKGIKTIDLGKELEWLNRVLPQLSRHNKIKIVEGLIRCSDGTWDYGQLSNGILYVATNGKVGTIYHEAFHAVTQWILTDEQLDKLYEAARKKYGNLDPVILEEKLADDFMLYTMGVQPEYKYEHQNIFRRLWQAIKNIFKHTSMIDQLYRDINNGVYTKAVMRECNNEFAGITPEDREISMGYRFIDSESRRLLKENNISEEQYEIMDAEEKRYLFHCVI